MRGTTADRSRSIPGSLVVGCGVVGAVHADALAELALTGRGRLAGVVDEDPARAEGFGRRWDVPWSTSLTEGLAWPGADVVHVCVPSGLHAAVGTKAAAAGRHVLAEKPIDVTLARADNLIAACTAAGVVLGVVFQHRFDPGFRELLALVQAGALGRLVLAEARVKWYRSQGYYDSAAWRGTWLLDGGGALINQSIHYLDLLLTLCGPVQCVTARTATACHAIEVEDIAAAVLRFESGALGTVLGSTAVFPGLPERLEVSGTEGSAILEDGELVLRATKKDIGPVGSHGLVAVPAQLPSQAPHEPPYGGRHTDQIADFLRAVRQGSRPTVTAEAGRAALALVLAIYEAAATGTEVRPAR